MFEGLYHLSHPHALPDTVVLGRPTFQICVWRYVSTEWTENHATQIEIFIYGCSRVHFDGYNKHTISRRSCPLQSVCWLQTLEVQHGFFTGVPSVYCRTLPVSSFLLNLPEWVYRHISRYFCVKQVNSISSGEPFPLHRKSAGQKHFRSTFGVK
jgi:hypothetical protein